MSLKGPGASSSDTIDSQNLPFPGDDLVSRVAGTSDRTWFFDSGRRSVEDISSILASARSRLQDHARILDFGCGCGRILVWLRDIADRSTLHGIDIDSAAIEWARKNLPYASVAVNNPLPPTDFPDGFFDFVYSQSVFTHIDEAYQDAWLDELRRIVKPAGLLLFSVNGEHGFQQFEEARRAQGVDSDSLRASRDRSGLLYIKDDSWTGGPFPDFYHSTFHTPAYVFAHWSRYFKIRAYVPQGSLAYQDFVLLERVIPQALSEAPTGQSAGIA